MRNGRMEAGRLLAQSLAAELVIVDCTAPEEVLRQRIRDRAARQQDASDADIAVLEHQLENYDPLTEEEREWVWSGSGAANSE